MNAISSLLTTKPKAKAAAPQPAPARRLLLGDRQSDDAAALVLLFMILFCLAVLAGFKFVRPVHVFVAGDIATQDVKADNDLLVEETDATHKKRELVASSQPPVYDLHRSAAKDLRAKVEGLLTKVNAAPLEELAAGRLRIFEGVELPPRSALIWRSDEFQQLMRERVLPWLDNSLQQGVVEDKRTLAAYTHGMVVRDLATGRESLRTDLNDVIDSRDLLKDLDDLLRQELDKPLRIRRAVEEMLSRVDLASLTLNQETTQARRREVVAAVEPVYTQIKRGEILVRQGERVNAAQQSRIQALFNSQKEMFSLSRACGVLILGGLMLLGLFIAAAQVRGRQLTMTDALFVGAILLLFGVAAKLVEVASEPLAAGLALPGLAPGIFAYGLPLAGAMGLLSLYFTVPVSLFAGLLLSFLCAKLTQGGLDLAMFHFLAGMFNVFLVKKARNRQELMTSIAPLGLAMLAAWAGVALLEFPGLTVAAAGAFLALFGGVSSLGTLLALSPVVEHCCGYTSRFKLLELMNMEQPLLRELMVNAPGTYHHCLIVSNMAEAGAQAIGANPLLAKVAALYHDIGKLKNPQYFIENQFGGINRHDKLAPSMSALILISHAKKGLELAKDHRLGPEISDVIQQHHGTRLMTFFYHKAREQAGEAVREEDFRYPGPKPQSKEAGLILLADTVEASSRTLVDPTPSRIKGHIQKIVRGIYSEGQLDESELTLKDLNLLEDAFLRILVGIFHQRIEYPGVETCPQESKTLEPQPLPVRQ